MKTRTLLVMSLIPLALARLGLPAFAAAPDPRQDEITKTAVAFTEAFHKGDAKAVAAFWAPDGDYVDMDGQVLKGRQAIEDDFAHLFAENKGLKVRIEVASVRFLTADTAIEDGVSSVISPDGGVPNRARYSNVLVKKDGQWLLASVRESAYVPPSNRDELQGLEWTIGEWVDQATEGHQGRAIFEWTPDENFIVCMRAVQVRDVMLDNGSQRIGWDASTKSVRSWSFESDGGFGEATWANDGAKWTIKSSAVLASGQKMTSTNIVTRVDANTITWQSTDQKLDGKPLPDSPVVTMKRVG